MNTPNTFAPTSTTTTPQPLDLKIAIIMVDNLHRGVAANRAAVLASGLPIKHPEILGRDITTADGRVLPGFTRVPIVVLSAPESSDLNSFSTKAFENGATVLVFLSRAQGLRSYDEYCQSIGHSQSRDLDVDACLICGPRKLINKLTDGFQGMK